MTHEDLGLTAAPHAHHCDCHDEDHGDPVLDARVIPHAIRHATIFGALDSLAPGAALVLAAPHDPLPLLDQARQRYGATFAVEYIERGPDAWKLRLTR